MNGRIVFMVGLGVAIIVLLAVVITRSSPSQPAAPTGAQPTTTQQEATPVTSTSQYQTYSQATYDAAKDKKRVLYFHADWCSVCRPLDKELSAKAREIPRDVVLFKLNYDTATELKKKYGVTYQHTFVQVDAQGNKVTAWSGGGLADLIANVQ